MSKHASPSLLPGTAPFRSPATEGGGRRLGPLCVAALVAAGCAREPVDQAVADGRALYEQHCVHCHGERALGDGAMASTLPVQPPSILEHLGHHTQAQLTQLIRGGIPPAMPPVPLSPEEVQMIVDYAWTLVPESQVETLRAMQRQMEMMGDSAGGMGSMGADGADHAMPPAAGAANDGR